MSVSQRHDPSPRLHHGPHFELHHLAQIECDAPAAPLTCIIWDISAEGANLTVADERQIPDEFTLLFRRRCRVVHHGDGRIGVRFVGTG